MISVMRTKFGPKVIGGIVAIIAGVFIFSGVFTPGSGSDAPSIAGEVNGEMVSYVEFSRALNQRIEFFKGMMGGKISEEQLAQFKIREAVFQDLAQKKVLTQIAKKEGFYPSLDQIREQILKMDAFKKDGRFDKLLYKNVLAQNQYTPTRFEELIGADLMEQNFKGFIGSLAYVSADEVEKSFSESKNKRKIKYLYVDNEALRKLDKSAKPNLDQFSAEMETKILPLVNAGSEAAIGKILNDTKAKIKTSDWLSPSSDMITGVGSIRMIQPELATMKKGDPAKALHLMGGTLYAKVVETESYDPSKVTPKERSEAYSKLQSQRQNEILTELMKSWTKDAKITRNDKVVVGNGGSSVPLTMDN
jgi:MFS superfamily sulfate permease-like transporter